MGDKTHVDVEMKPLYDIDVDNEKNFILKKDIKTEVKDDIETKVELEIKTEFENHIKTEVESDSDPDATLIDNDKIKIEIEEADVKKECFGDMHMDTLQNQPLKTAVGEEYQFEFAFVDIKNIREQEGVPGKNLPAVYETKSLESNISNASANADSILVMKQGVDESMNEYKCDLCKKVFTNGSNVKSHDCMRNEKNKNFNENKTSLEQKRSHIGDKPYSCGICKKSYIKKSHLNEHERIHTGERPFSCDVCKKDFTRKSHLNEHMRVHTTDRHIPCFFCNVCKKSYKRKSYFARHERTHTK